MRSRYVQMEIEGASPLGLVVRMYDGALGSIRRARDHHDEGRIRDRGAEISRALDIVSELRSGLDLEQGGEIARNLEALYLFAGERLMAAGSGAREGLDEALAALMPLYEAWSQLASQPASSFQGDPE